MIVRPWIKGDSDKIVLQEGQSYLHSFIDVTQDLSELSDAGLAWVGEQDGEIMIISGLAYQWSGRALAWALISKNAGKCFSSIHRAVKRFLNLSDCRRIEANIDVGFDEAKRWIELLGFEYEGYMKAYRPDGEDMLLYARVK